MLRIFFVFLAWAAAVRADTTVYSVAPADAALVALNSRSGKPKYVLGEANGLTKSPIPRFVRDLNYAHIRKDAPITKTKLVLVIDRNGEVIDCAAYDFEIPAYAKAVESAMKQKMMTFMPGTVAEKAVPFLMTVSYSTADPHPDFGAGINELKNDVIPVLDAKGLEFKPDVLYFEDTPAARKGAEETRQMFAGRQAVAVVKGRIPDMTFPEVVERIAPDFPEPLRHNLERHTTVIVDYVVGEDGTVLYAVANRESDSRVQSLAVEAIRRWRFKPAQREGKNVRCHLRIPIVFN